ncbi:MAG: ABC transporter ATP-binding protein/permease [Clostridium sp.]|uniref:ABC transporter ATP-binding protein/permease n=1 Tax=Clostridium sp. TaxID=1506 RepID=UPI002FCBE164
MIEIKNLTKIYEKTTIIKNANYTFPDTGLICLLGESGCGKTTLINLIAGLDKDYSGDIIVGGIPLDKMSDDDLCNYRRDNIGFVFQNYNLLYGYTSLENILYPCSLNDNNNEDSTNYAKKLLSDFGICEKENEKIQNLSGGQKQRVAIARALIQHPDIILADEPTGALDRKTSMEIMKLLKEISNEKLVIVITHDWHVCDYADEVITISDRQIVTKVESDLLKKGSKMEIELQPSRKINTFKIGAKNYKVSFLKYFSIALVFSIAILCFILSLSSANIMESSVEKFKDKNTAFNNFYIKNDENVTNIYDLVSENDKVGNVYKQYKIKDISLSIDDHTENMSEKYPMPKATESISYGIMPRNNKSEVVLTPSLAKKFSKNINELIGKTLTIKYNNKTYSLTISGIYNAGYDDFIVSSDIERTFYKGNENDKYYSISFDVEKFEDINIVNDELAKKDISCESAASEVKSIQKSFQKISKLFTVISLMILILCIFIVTMLFIKLQAARYRVVGLLATLGFNRKSIAKIIYFENLLLASTVTLITGISLYGVQIVTSIWNLNFNISIVQIVYTVVFATVAILGINFIISKKLLRTSPSVALRK